MNPYSDGQAVPEWLMLLWWSLAALGGLAVLGHWLAPQIRARRSQRRQHGTTRRMWGRRDSRPRAKGGAS